MVTVNVDIPALKARHPLGDAVEAAGVRLRGRGRVRQGVCPFHDEAEGAVRRVTRHRIPGSVGKDSEGILGPTNPPGGESQRGQ